MNRLHDIFFSYARADNNRGWIDKFVESISDIHQTLTGEKLKYFIDRSSILTAEIWDKQISTALNSSVIMVAIVSPSFIKSEWCRREWQVFVKRETKARKSGSLKEGQGLIAPALLWSFDRGRFDADETRMCQDIQSRQWEDFTSQVRGAPLRRNQLVTFTETLIDLIADAEPMWKPFSSLPSEASTQVVLDSSSGLMWIAAPSAPMKWNNSLEFVQGLNIAGFKDWRLPTKDELETLLDLKRMPASGSDESTFPLKPPFNSIRFGHIHSRTAIDGDDKRGHFIMNCRNGHIFNGRGYDAFVLAVRSFADTCGR